MERLLLEFIQNTEEGRVKYSPEQKKTYKNFETAYLRMAEKLSQENQNELRELINLHEMLFFTENDTTALLSFKLGALMMMEICGERERFSGKG